MDYSPLDHYSPVFKLYDYATVREHPVHDLINIQVFSLKLDIRPEPYITVAKRAFII